MGNTQNEVLEKYRQWLKIERGNSNSTIKDSIGNTKRFLVWITKRGGNLQTLSQDTINDYLSYCYDKHALNSMVSITINLRKFCCYFLEKNLKVKIATIKPPEREKTAFTQQEVRSMFDMVKGNHLHTAILKVLYYTGARSSEIIALNIDDVDFSRLQIRIRHGKGHQMRVVNITEDCAVSIQRWLDVRNKPASGFEDALFILPHGKRFSRFYLWDLVKMVASKAGITKNAYPHKFRITLITHCSEAGLSPREIQVQSGHKTISTLLGYIQHTPSRIRESYERVFKDLGSEPALSQRKTLSSDTYPAYYKKLAIEKYLHGDIESKELYTLLNALEKKANDENKFSDMAYQ